MKATVEIPDLLFRQAKAVAARRGVSLRQLFTEALREAFGGLHHLHRENRRVERWIEEEFERIDEDCWR